MGDLILHVGMEKTGSTAIQRAFHGYDDGHLAYAPFDRPNHSMALQMLLFPYAERSSAMVRSGMPAAAYDALRQQAAAQLRAALELDRARVVISAETVMGLEQDRLRQLADRLSGRRLRVLAYVRDPLGFASSAYQQILKSGAVPDGVPRQHFRARIAPLLAVFGAEAVTLVRFDPARFRDGSVVQDFADRVGAQPGRIEDRRENESLTFYTAAALAWWLLEGQSSPGTPAHGRARAQLMRHLLRTRPGGAADRPAPWMRGTPVDPLARGWQRFRLARALVESGLDRADIAWMEARLGEPLIPPAAHGPEVGAGAMGGADPKPDPEPDIGITSPEDFQGLARDAHIALAPLVAHYDLTPDPDTPPTLAAMNALYRHFLIRAEAA